MNSQTNSPISNLDASSTYLNPSSTYLDPSSTNRPLKIIDLSTSIRKSSKRKKEMKNLMIFQKNINPEESKILSELYVIYENYDEMMKLARFIIYFN